MRFCRIVLFLFLLSSSLTSFCQQTYFLYIQNDQRQPFFVKLDRKVFSSSNNGYLIIPKLPAGSVNLAIGFPKSTAPDLRFTYTIDKQDAGFLLRSFGEKGFGLFNLQTLDVVMQQQEENSSLAASTSDPFAEKLANVVGDPSIAHRKPANNTNPTPPVHEPIIVNPIVPADPLPAATTPATAVEVPVVSSSAVSADSLPMSPADSIESLKPVLGDSLSGLTSSMQVDSTWKQQTHIGMLSSGVGEAGLQLIYVDTVSTRVDTIQVLIPAVAEASTTVPTASTDSLANSTPTTGVVVAGQEKLPSEPVIGSNAPDSVAGKAFLPIELTSPHQQAAPHDSLKATVLAPAMDTLQSVRISSDTAIAVVPIPASNAAVVIPQSNPSVVEPAAVKDSVVVEANSVVDSIATNMKSAALPMFNSDCKSLASEDDFLKLRKKMAAGSDDDDMIGIARKAMKSKCYTTTHIRNLSVLFLNDAGRYGFLDMAYAYASDTGNYPQLVDLLKDSYYINRFKAMIRQ